MIIIHPSFTFRVQQLACLHIEHFGIQLKFNYTEIVEFYQHRPDNQRILEDLYRRSLHSPMQEYNRLSLSVLFDTAELFMKNYDLQVRVPVRSSLFLREINIFLERLLEFKLKGIRELSFLNHSGKPPEPQEDYGFLALIEI